MGKLTFLLILSMSLLIGCTKHIVSRDSAISIANKKAVELGYRLENLNMESC
jgi:hypothetical protein